MNDDISHYDRLWKDYRVATDARFWNEGADDFNTNLMREGSARRRRKTVGLILEKTGLDSTSALLDIGCGPGQYTLDIARGRGESVGIDVASRMIELARDNARAEGTANIRFEVMDWKEANLDALGWRKRFDLVLASRTPAVGDAASLFRMNEASRGSCCLVTKLEEYNTVRDSLGPVVGWDPGKDVRGSTLYCAFNLLWLSGCFPEVAYSEDHWVSNDTPEELVRTYTHFFTRTIPMDDGKRDAIRDAIYAMPTADGRIRGEGKSRTCFLFWKPPQRIA